MKTIAYYISDYGYGHASRSIAVIRKLLKDQEVKIIVCHSFALSFLKESLQSNRVSFRTIKTDVGYFLEKDSIHPDKVRLFKEFKNFVADWDFKVVQEQEFLELNYIDLVISDISPLAFEAAQRLYVPSIGLSNFTWYTAYHDLIDDGELKPYKLAYQNMTHLYSLAGSNENWNVPTNHYGFFSREVDLLEVQRIRHLINPNETQNVIFLGLGMKIDVGSLEQLPIWDSPNCVFLVSSNVQVNRPNVFQIPSDYLESQNYIAASDLVISKAGWGMIGEAMSANVPLLILNRASMKEDQNTINYLNKHHLCHTIEWDDFKTYMVDNSTIKGVNRELRESSPSNNNEADKIANDILKILK
ncbi:glycosyltransferase family protein [Bacillus sp. UNC41MFS5]|uniref:glycosyltransferase family protein n=1 Tax=Bacillus sp. UNC41MFS5 TaxID=1449046 RepID=UPI0004788748|nr:glycosyltransferase family protein [Bacillus sp. UNC41MFS5]